MRGERCGRLTGVGVVYIGPAGSLCGGALAWSVGGAVAVGSRLWRRNGRGWVRGKGVAGGAGDYGNVARITCSHVLCDVAVDIRR
jgi:hypothetical protein